MAHPLHVRTAMQTTPSRPSWALILTPPGERKRDEVLVVAAALRERGLRTAGFAQRRLAEGSKKYELRSLGQEAPPVPIVRRGSTPGPDEEPFCSCVFRPDAFATGRTWLASDLPGCDVAVLDEISRLEAAGGGHAGAVTEALGQAPVTVLSVRADRLAALVERFGLGDPLAVLEQGEPTAPFVEAVVAHVRG